MVNVVSDVIDIVFEGGDEFVNGVQVNRNLYMEIGKGARQIANVLKDGMSFGYGLCVHQKCKC
jgi:hypothetical protein